MRFSDDPNFLLSLEKINSHSMGLFAFNMLTMPIHYQPDSLPELSFLFNDDRTPLADRLRSILTTPSRLGDNFFSGLKGFKYRLQLYPEKLATVKEVVEQFLDAEYCLPIFDHDDDNRSIFDFWERAWPPSYAYRLITIAGPLCEIAAKADCDVFIDLLDNEEVQKRAGNLLCQAASEGSLAFVKKLMSRYQTNHDAECPGLADALACAIDSEQSLIYLRVSREKNLLQFFSAKIPMVKFLLLSGAKFSGAQHSYDNLRLVTRALKKGVYATLLDPTSNPNSYTDRGETESLRPKNHTFCSFKIFIHGIKEAQKEVVSKIQKSLDEGRPVELTPGETTFITHPDYQILWSEYFDLDIIAWEIEITANKDKAILNPKTTLTRAAQAIEEFQKRIAIYEYFTERNLLSDQPKRGEDYIAQWQRQQKAAQFLWDEELKAEEVQPQDNLSRTLVALPLQGHFHPRERRVPLIFAACLTSSEKLVQILAMESKPLDDEKNTPEDLLFNFTYEAPLYSSKETIPPQAMNVLTFAAAMQCVDQLTVIVKHLPVDSTQRSQLLKTALEAAFTVDRENFKGVAETLIAAGAKTNNPQLIINAMQYGCDRSMTLYLLKKDAPIDATFNIQIKRGFSLFGTAKNPAQEEAERRTQLLKQIIIRNLHFFVGQLLKNALAESHFEFIMQQPEVKDALKKYILGDFLDLEFIAQQKPDNNDPTVSRQECHLQRLYRTQTLQMRIDLLTDISLESQTQTSRFFTEELTSRSLNIFGPKQLKDIIAQKEKEIASKSQRSLWESKEQEMQTYNAPSSSPAPSDSL